MSDPLRKRVTLSIFLGVLRQFLSGGKEETGIVLRCWMPVTNIASFFVPLTGNFQDNIRLQADQEPISLNLKRGLEIVKLAKSKMAV